MFGKKYAAGIINRSAENEADRRRFLRSAGLTGLGVVGTTALSGALPGVAAAAGAQPESAQATADAQALTDASVLNFALNLEYLEAEFYLRAVTGHGLAEKEITGKGKPGPVTGGRQVNFQSRRIRQYAEEIAGDERHHVDFLRTALGKGAVARPAIDLKASFTAAAQAAGIVRRGEQFDAFACEENFLLGAFLFEDVGVTAYKGASPLIKNKTYLEAAAGILAVEAYHAANIRSAIIDHKGGLLGTGLFGRDLTKAANKLSAARDSLDGKTDLDQGVTTAGDRANIVPTDKFGVAFSRSAGQVLNVVYLTPKAARSGGFFPKGVNGDITTSAKNG